MRLLQQASDGGFRLTRDLVDNIPPYAILSHTWGDDDQELTIQDIQQHTGQHKAGYRKLTFCGAQAALDDLQYFWVDTCCIDKSSSAELTEAINSMFRWYQNAAQCYVDLADVSAGAGSRDAKPPGASWTAAFRKSRWFSRGWTLQELLAPRSVTFFSVESQRLGDKTSLGGLLQEITGISADALRGQPLSQFSVHERFSWMRSRVTKRPEDRAYSLLGIFDIYLPLIYGEGEENAFIRLRVEIQKRSQDTARTIPDKCDAHFIVPFGQNENFVGRESILRQLIGRLPPTAYPNTCQRTVVEGLGGIGKTQVAIEVAYRIRDAHLDCSVFWVPAVDMAMFENAYREIGRALGVNRIDEDKADVKKLVKVALSQADAGQWLLIIDNADDMLLLTKGQLMSYLPFSREGSILFTTRNHHVAVRLDSRVISLPEPDQAEASELLHQGLEERQIGSLKHTMELLEYLAYLPLAVRQASAYMKSNRTVTISKYAWFCSSSDRERINLLAEEFTDQARYETVQNPVALTWLISFEHITRDKPLAAAYLQFVCYLAEKDIPAALLPPGDSERTSYEAISILEAYAFLQRKEPSVQTDDVPDDVSGDAPEKFDVHRLVRLVVRNWLREQGREKEQVTKTISTLAQKLPLPTHENRKTWSGYLPHTQTVLEFEGQCANAGALWRVFYYTGIRTMLTGKYTETEMFCRKAVDVAKKDMGNTHHDTLNSMNNLANVLERLGKYEEAETMHRQTLALKKTVLGPHHPDTLSNMNNLATVLKNQGRYEEANTMHRQTLALRETVLGPDHSNTLASMNNLALVLKDQGKYKEAEAMQREELRLSGKGRSSDHPSTLNSMNNLATVLKHQGKYEEAETIHRQTLARKEMVLGPDHPSTLDSINNLANVLDQQGKYKEAETMHRHTLALRETMLGTDHPSTLTNISDLALVLNKQGKYKEAETMHRQTLALRETTLSPGHPHTFDSMNALSTVLQSQGKNEEAERLQSQALAGLRKVLGPEHPQTLESMNNLANVLTNQSKYEEAERMHRQTLELRAMVLGRQHPSTLKSIVLIANVLENQGKHAEAEQMHQQKQEWKDGGRLREAEEQREEVAVGSADNGAAPTKSHSNGQCEPPDDQVEPESKRRRIR